MKLIYKILCGIFIVGIMLLGCKKESVEVSFLEIKPADVTTMEQPFVHTASNRSIPINSNLEVIKVSTDVDWCKVSIVENDGYSLRLDVYPNEGFEQRTAKITVYGVGVQDITIPIVQWSSEPALAVAESEGIEVIDGELDFTLHITSNLDFKIELPNWIMDAGDNTPYIGSKLYTFIASPIAPGDRVGYIKILTDEHPELDQIIEIAQHQNVLQPVLGDFLPVSGEKESAVVLNGTNFGTNKELVKVYFNAVEAEITQIEDNAITVLVPRAPGNAAIIKVEIMGQELTYSNPFDYVPSWGLYTVTGDGDATFRGGTLAQGRLKARYISLDGNGNIFASHRDEASIRHVVRINEAENIVESVGSFASPNGSTVGKNNIVYVANDNKNARSYYELNPSNNWTPVERTITYVGEAPPASAAYMYRLVYNHNDNHLYGVVGHNDGTVIKVNPATYEGKVIYKFGANPFWYGAAINPAGSQLYIAVNAAAIGYGPYRMELNNPADGFTRLNAQGGAGSATVAQLNDGPLSQAGFGQAWDYEFGPDGNLYVSDFTNHVIRKINLNTQMVETLVGKAGQAGNTNGKKDKAQLNGPRGLAWNQNGTALYVFDFNGNRLRKWAFD